MERWLKCVVSEGILDIAAVYLTNTSHTEDVHGLLVLV